MSVLFMKQIFIQSYNEHWYQSLNFKANLPKQLGSEIAFIEALYLTLKASKAHLTAIGIFLSFKQNQCFQMYTFWQRFWLFCIFSCKKSRITLMLHARFTESWLQFAQKSLNRLQKGRFSTWLTSKMSINQMLVSQKAC